MERSKRLALYLGSFVVVVGAYVSAYRWGMATFEGEERTYLDAAEIVVQSLTTTGYGQDAPWESSFMQVLVILVQVTGIAYIFVAFPLFVVPWLERMVSTSAPDEVDDLTDHVVVLGYTSLFESLIEELDARGREYVVVHRDEEAAIEMHRSGRRVLYGDPSSEDVLVEAMVSDATAVVIDTTDDGLEPVLSVRDVSDTVPITCLIDDQSTARYLRYAGVDEVLSPGHRLGKSLADKVREIVVPLDDMEFDEGFVVAEFPVDPDGPLAGTTLRSWRETEETGATLLGAWVRGDFVPVGVADAHLDGSSSLLFAGGVSQMEDIAERLGVERRDYTPTEEPVIVVGAGVTGRTTVGILERAGIETVVVDRADDEYVDVVGDATTEEVLTEAGIEDVGTIIVTVTDEEVAIRTTLVASATAPDVEVIVAAPNGAVARTCYNAGADYVLTVPQIAGRMVVLTLFEGGAMTLGERLRILRVGGSTLAGSTVGDLRRDERPVPTILAVEREGDVVDPVDRLELDADDHLLVAGTEDELREFEARIEQGSDS